MLVNHCSVAAGRPAARSSVAIWLTLWPGATSFVRSKRCPNPKATSIAAVIANQPNACICLVAGCGGNDFGGLAGDLACPAHCCRSRDQSCAFRKANAHCRQPAGCSSNRCSSSLRLLIVQLAVDKTVHEAGFDELVWFVRVIHALIVGLVLVTIEFCRAREQSVLAGGHVSCFLFLHDFQLSQLFAKSSSGSV